MAREFAKHFYKTKEWQQCREYIYQRDKGLCQECLKRNEIKAGEEVHHIIWLKPSNIDNPMITLNPDNLELVCKDCHFEIHRKIHHDISRKRLPSLSNGYYLDDDGDLKKMRVYIVYGSPASGKSTYVKQHMQYGDMVVDLDMLKQAISYCFYKEYPDNLHDVAISLRDKLYEFIAAKELQCRNVWVIASLPRKKERYELCTSLDAELIFIDTDLTTCIKRVIKDEYRKDKDEQVNAIEKWFGCYEK